jgi:hypothetical protein
VLYTELILSNWREQTRRVQEERGEKLSTTNNLYRELAKLHDMVIADVCTNKMDCRTGIIV